MSVEITVPQMAESVVEATVGAWLKSVGDAVSAGEVLLELETDKVAMEVTAETSGVLEKIVAETGATVTVGDVLADLQERDRRDSERASAPLTKADDAILLDTTDLSIEAAIHAALDIVGRR